MVDSKRLDDQDRLLAELLLRISTVEKLLIDKNVTTADEYNEIFNKSVSKLMDVLKVMNTPTEEVAPEGTLKN